LKLLAAFLLLLIAAGAGFIAGDRTQEAETTTVTVRQTRTASRTTTLRDTAVPAAVLEKREQVLQAAGDRDYEALARLADPDGFEYTFGGPVPGGPAQYWRERAQEGEDPLAALERILRLPYTVSSGHYVWPFAYDKTGDQLTNYERSLLGDLLPGGTIGDTGYLGWRAGFTPNGDWVFFVAGD
jgi:hypothetical protein